MNTRFHLRLLLAVLFCSQPLARAAVLTDPSQLMPGNTLITFESLTLGPVTNPLVIGDATFSSSTTLYLWDTTSYSPPPMVTGKALSTNSSPPFVNLRIDFAVPVGEIGLGWWDANVPGNELRVYNSSNVLLESASIPTGPPGGSFAAFRGISRATNDIAYAEMHLPGSDEYYGVDNVSYGQVPEPGSAVLLLAGGLLLARRHRRARQD